MRCGAGAPPSSKGVCGTVVHTPDSWRPRGDHTLHSCLQPGPRLPAALPNRPPPGSRACQPSGFRGDLVIWIPAGVKEGHQEATTGCRHFMPV